MKDLLIFILWILIRLGPGVLLASIGFLGDEWKHGVIAGCGVMLIVMSIERMVKEIKE